MRKILISLYILATITFISCENEPVALPNINMDIVDDTLFNFLLLIKDEPVEEDLNCIEFNYTFTIYVFDDELNLEDVVTVYDNSSFINLLGNLDETQSISVSYPIEGTLNNGEAVSISTNEELTEAIRACSLINRQRQCNNTLEDCDWTVKATEDAPNAFEGDGLKLSNDGTLSLFNKTTIYYGTWITLNIGDTLFLNIDLNDNSDIEEFWDHNWKVVFLSEDLITISNELTTVSIEKNCNEICTLAYYEVCEFEDNPGFALFDFPAYIPCISIASPQDPIAAVEFTFYETEEDATNATNPINTEPYTNLENPQTIYVRIAYKTSGVLIETRAISINAVPCTTG